MDELLILVDTNDKEIGYLSKEETHRLGKLHRAFSVFIIRDGQMLLQRRKLNKYHSGGLWANACCSHPRRREKLADAAYRRLLEEMGISCDLSEIGHFVYRTKFEESLYEYEYDHVFLGFYSGAIYPNEDEIEETRWITFEELRKDLVLNPEKYASWFLTAAPMVLERIEKNV